MAHQLAHFCNKFPTEMRPNIKLYITVAPEIFYHPQSQIALQKYSWIFTFLIRGCFFIAYGSRNGKKVNMKIMSKEQKSFPVSVQYSVSRTNELQDIVFKLYHFNLSKTFVMQYGCLNHIRGVLLIWGDRANHHEKTRGLIFLSHSTRLF